MNREIKFRAWHKTQKRYIEWDCIDLENSFLAILMKYSFTLKATIPFEDIILEQYTGLKDKNGKEIYEGDIVKVYDEFVGKIVFYSGVFVYQEPSGASVSLGSFNPLNTEVIGNIHENEGLLKGEEKMRDAFGVKALEELGYRKHNEFEVKTTKAKTSIKTFKELGYIQEVEIVDGEKIEIFRRGYNLHDGFVLKKDGKVYFGIETGLSQDLHKAIEHEMKKRGWWK